MMISPEGYYELFLKGKSKEEILACIRRLRREIREQKRVLVAARTKLIAFSSNSPSLIITMDREYLERAKQAYAEAGGTWVPTWMEKADERFDRSIGRICGIGLAFTDPEEKVFSRAVRLKPDGFCVHTCLSGEVEGTCGTSPYEGSRGREDYLKKLRGFHIGEWKRNRKDPGSGEGARWEVVFSYDDGSDPVRYGGTGPYPYNMEEFCMRILGCTPDGTLYEEWDPEYY